MNKVILIGRLTNDPELRYGMASGTPITTFTIAVNRFKGKEKETDFINIVAFGKIAETCGNNLSKGRLVAIEGRIQTRSYESQNGRKYVTEVVANEVKFLDYPKKGDAYEEDLPEITGFEEFGDEPF